MRPNTDLRKKIQDYSYGLNDTLSSTESTKIYKGMRETNKEIVAIKVVDIKRFKTKQEKRPLETEIDALRKTKHTNVIKCLDVYSTLNNCYIITEYCSGGDLQSIISQRKEKLPLEEAVSIFRDICKGYKAIYLQGYIHRNLNPSNILVKNGECKINDFGLASKQLDIPTKIMEPIGLSPYRSPESLKNETLGPKCDIWALGVILYLLLHNRLPFRNYDDKFAFKNEIEFDNIPVNAKELILKCLQHHSLRITFPEFEAHEFISEINPMSPTNIIALKGDFTIPVTRVTCKIQTKISPELEKAKYQKAKRGEIAAKAQIGFMRFLFRLQAMLPEGQLQFLVIRHLLVILESLKSSMNLNSPHECEYMNEFFQSERAKKMGGIIQEYCKKYAKVGEEFERYIIKGTKNKKIIQYFDNHLVRSEGFVITILPALISFIQASLAQLSNSKQLSYLKQEEPLPKQLQALALRLDFCVTYYQLNCLSISDWSNLLQFAEYSKLDQILDNPPSELCKIHLKGIESKIHQLGI